MMIPSIKEVYPHGWFWGVGCGYLARLRRREPDPTKLPYAAVAYPDLRLTLLQPRAMGIMRTDLF